MLTHSLHSPCQCHCSPKTPPSSSISARGKGRRYYATRRSGSIAHYCPPPAPSIGTFASTAADWVLPASPASYMHRCEMTFIKRCTLANWPGGWFQRFTGVLRACRWLTWPSRPNQSCATSAASKQALAGPGAVATVPWFNIHPHASRSR